MGVYGIWRGGWFWGSEPYLNPYAVPVFLRYLVLYKEDARHTVRYPPEGVGYRGLYTSFLGFMGVCDNLYVLWTLRGDIFELRVQTLSGLWVCGFESGSSQDCFVLLAEIGFRVYPNPPM